MIVVHSARFNTRQAPIQYVQPYWNKGIPPLLHKCSIFKPKETLGLDESQYAITEKLDIILIIYGHSNTLSMVACMAGA